MSLHHVRAVRATLEPFRWSWAESHAEAIASGWRERVAARPRLFNGRVLMTASLEIAADGATARFFETDYAAMLAWIGAGCPDTRVANGFAMGALQCADGAFLLGRMADGTANAGRLYFPCGTPDLSDVTPDGAVDLAGSLTREIAEETGLAARDMAVEPGWTIVRAGGLLAFMRRVRLPVSSQEACRRIRRHLAALPEPELADIVAVSGPDGLEAARGTEADRGTDAARMPAVVPLYLAWAFAADAGRSEAQR